MRTRTKTIPGLYRAAMCSTYSGFTGMSHISVPDDPPLLRQYMRDEFEKQHLFNDVLNSKVSLHVEGFHPPFTPDGGADRPYSWYYEEDPAGPGLGGSDFWLPSIIPAYAALQQWPEMRNPIDGDRFAKTFLGYPDWALVKWKGPQVSLATGFSLINFLLEWKESMHLIHSWFSKRELLNRWHELTAKNHTLGQRARAVAQERLAHVYGTKLFLHDTFTLWKILTTWKERADKFLGSSAFVQKSYKRPVSIAWSTSLGRRSCPVFGASNSESEMLVSYEATARAVLAYSYHVPELKGFIARLAQLSDSLGVNLDAGIAWDGVPLSFVVDWFINISEWLHANANLGPLIKADVILEDFCHSAKIYSGRSIIWHRDEVNGTRPTGIVSGSCTWYTRTRAKPPVFDKTNLDLVKEPWKINRIINAVSLGIHKSKIGVEKRKKFLSRRAMQVLTLTKGFGLPRWLRRKYLY